MSIVRSLTAAQRHVNFALAGVACEDGRQARVRGLTEQDFREALRAILKAKEHILNAETIARDRLSPDKPCIHQWYQLSYDTKTCVRCALKVFA